MAPQSELFASTCRVYAWALMIMQSLFTVAPPPPLRPWCLMQTLAGRRRLQGSNQQVVVTVRTTFTGSDTPATTIVDAVTKSTCDGVPGLSGVLDACKLEKGYSQQAQIQPVGMTLVQQPAAEPNLPLVFIAAYTESQAAISMPFSLVSDPADAFTCNRSAQGTSQVFTCYPKRTFAKVTLTSSGPNPDSPSDRVTAVLTLTDVGELLSGTPGACSRAYSNSTVANGQSQRGNSQTCVPPISYYAEQYSVSVSCLPACRLREGNSR